MANIADIREPISTDDCIKKMFEVLVTGNGDPSMMVRMDRAERMLNLLAKVMTLTCVPLFLAAVIAIFTLAWSLITHQTTITTIP